VTGVFSRTGVDELGIASVLEGEPVELVRCKTIDLEVPARAEIVLEGKVRTDILEPEGSFGESHGYSDPRTLSFVFEVSAITHRNSPVFLSIVSQLTPSESSKMKQKGYEADFLTYLRNDCGFRGVTEVRLYEDLLNRQLGVVKLKKRDAYEPMNALHAFIAKRHICKFLVAVDDDIDAADPIAVNWAIVTRCQPHRDVRIIHPRPLPWGPIQYVADGVRYDLTDSALLIDATQKAPLPPISLPDRSYMEEALKVWQELGLPEVKARSPWYGYSLGDWTEVSAEEARLAVQGRHYETAEKLASQQIKVKPGTRLAEVRHHPRP
jgi:4-hydroxy-3-polyprenylbenzoate decarboxylase